MPAHKYAGVPASDDGNSKQLEESKSLARRGGNLVSGMTTRGFVDAKVNGSVQSVPSCDIVGSPARPLAAGEKIVSIHSRSPPKPISTFTASIASITLSTSPPGEKMLNKYFPAGKYGQYVAALIATSSLFVSAQVCGWPTGALPKINDGSAGYEMTDLQKSLLVSLPNIAGVIMPIPCGYVIDMIGRKTTLTCSIFFVMISWLVLAFSKNVWLILAARLFMGMWNGTEYVTVSIFIAEVVDPSVRGSLISITGMMFYSGALYISFISFASYQTMTLLCLVSPALLFFGFLFIPESPYFFLMHGRREEAEKSILWLRGVCHPKDLDRMEVAVKEQLAKQGTFGEIFSKPSNRKAFFIVECFKICSATSATLLLFPFSTQLLPHGWLTPQESHIVLCVSWVVSAIISSALMLRFKRRSLMMVSTVGTMALLCTTAGWYYLRDFSDYDTSTTSWLPLILLCVAVFFETIGIINIPNIMKGELFPINIKTKACALSCMTAGGFETINYLLFYQINHHIGMWFNIFKSALTAAFSLFIVLFFMIETKGRSLEAIQEMLNAKKPPKSCHDPPISPIVAETIPETELDTIEDPPPEKV